VNLSSLRVLLDYHYWARDRTLDAVQVLTPEQYTRDMGNSFRSVRDTVVHIYSAEWVWHSRWNGHSPMAAVPTEQFPDVDTIRKVWSELEAKMRAFLESTGESGLTRELEYKMFSGAAGKSMFWHMLQHVVNHASYHRGQVTTLLRQQGANPPKGMDLIAYYRERGG